MRLVAPAMAGWSLGVLAACAAFGQAPAPQFETAEIRASAAGTRESGGFLPGGRFECRAKTLLELIATAYRMDEDSIVGGPEWLNADRFDVMAKATAADASTGAMREMLQRWLAERFGLVVRRGRKEMPVYLLEAGTEGPKLRASADGGAADCPTAGGGAGMNHRVCHAYTMADLARLLPQIARNYVDHPVVDMTGLAGAYDFALDWMGKGAYLAVRANPGRGPAVSMFDALEKLGLELKPGMQPAAVLAIERVVRMAPGSGAGAGSSAGASAEFDVAEVRPSRSAERESLTALPDGQLEIRAYTLRMLIATAFEVEEDRVAGGPKWVDEERYDVIAKSLEVMSPHALRGMLKRLIAERFDLRTHSEDRPVAVFALVAGKRPKLQPADGTARSECKLTLAEAGRSYVCRNTTMAQLAERLPAVTQAYVTHPIVDLTGMEGAYDFELTWTPKSRLAGTAAGSGNGGQGVVPQASAPGDVTIFEAIGRQLGLRLEERKYPLPVIVIDSAERVR